MFKPLLGAAALGLMLLCGTQAAQAHGWGWGGPHIVFGFGGPVYYAPPPVYYAPPPVYYTQPGYYAPPPPPPVYGGYYGDYGD